MPFKILMARKMGIPPTVAMANVTLASGIKSCDLTIKTDGTWSSNQEGSPGPSGIWLTGGLASDVNLRWSYVNGVNPNTAMSINIDYPMDVNRAFTLSAGVNPKTSTFDLTFSRISDGAVLDTARVFFSLEGGGGGSTVTL